jgi:hypothetical protein
MSEVVMKPKVIGRYAKLEKHVSRAGLSGKWRDLKYGQKQFRTNKGGVLNWWEGTGDSNVSGLKDRS